jgi:GT2 family glycosyltransferase
MMTRKDIFSDLDGFDENLPGNFNDVDFCLRLRERGWLIVWTPYANLIQHSPRRAVTIPMREIESDCSAKPVTWRKNGARKFCAIHITAQTCRFIRAVLSLPFRPGGKMKPQ